MIVHTPYGIDDPYKSIPTERFPRDPRPGDAVQIGFRTGPDATTAWAEVIHNEPSEGSSSRRVEAVSLGAGLWMVDLGAFEHGTVEYVLGAQRHTDDVVRSDPYLFDVGTWTQVSGITSVSHDHDTVTLRLATTTGSAHLRLFFPTAGACRCELALGDASVDQTDTTASASRTTPRIQVHDSAERVHIAAVDIEVVIGKSDLTLRASLPGAAAEPLFGGSLAFRWLERTSNSATSVELAFQTQANEWLYGLGERYMDANRNGHEWDVRVYEEYKEQRKRAYIPVPFLLSNRGYGLWLDADEPSYFDLTSSVATVSLDRLNLDASGARRPLLSFCILVAEQPYDVTATFTKLTGDINVPPEWAFGPWMSANTWNTQAKAEEVVARTVAEAVPASVIVLEAWSDESTFYIFNDAEYEAKPGSDRHTLGDFKFSGRWPDPKRLIDYCHEHGVRVVLWQIPVHKRLTEPHAQHDEDGAHMIEQEFAILNEDGTPYRNKGWWFGDALVADFTNPDASEWWFSKRRYLFDELGIDGMKTDGGEHLWGRDLRAHDGSRGLELFNTYANHYVGAYHSFIQDRTDGDGVTFSRAGYTGAQRFPIHWAGDEDSTWSAYRASVRAGLSAGVSGVSMWAWDLGGFSGEIPPPDLYVRSVAMATFSPIMQFHSEPHSASECRDRTPWNIAERHDDSSALSIYRGYAQLRARLRSYLHGEALASARSGIPLMRYPALEFKDVHDFLAHDEYAYLLGRDLLVAPVTERGVETREVRLPPGSWVDLWSGAELDGGRIFHAPAPIERIPVFVRASSERLSLLLAAAADFTIVTSVGS